jgi:ketosteroid isomerase-like protein
MSPWEIAQQFTALCVEGRSEEAGERFWAEDVVSIEASPDAPVSRGIEAARAKTIWWNENHKVHEVRVEGPWPNGDQFTLRFWMDVTPNDRPRFQHDEIALYTVRDGKIAEERFFYQTA